MDSGTHGLKCMSCGSVFRPLHPPPLPHSWRGLPKPLALSPLAAFNPQVCEQHPSAWRSLWEPVRLRPALSCEAAPALTAPCLPPSHPHMGASCTRPGSAAAWRGCLLSSPVSTPSRTLPPWACHSVSLPHCPQACPRHFSVTPLGKPL